MTGNINGVPELTREESIDVEASVDELYDLLSDVTRTGEWSPVCATCWWDDPSEAGQVDAWFTGRNVLPERTWETRSQVIVADRGREFAFVVGGSFVRWGYTFAPNGSGTTLTESWDFLPAGIAMFEQNFVDTAQAEIADRSEAARTGIPMTLAAIKRIAESAKVSTSG